MHPIPQAILRVDAIALTPKLMVIAPAPNQNALRIKLPKNPLFQGLFREIESRHTSLNIPTIEPVPKVKICRMIINRLPALTIANVSKPAKITGQPGDLISFPARCDNRAKISWLRPADRSRYWGCGLVFLILDNRRRNLASDNGRRPHLSPDGETTDQANFNTSSPIPVAA